jgi:hypothetical protein
MNPVPALGGYAALLRAAGEPLHWPGGATGITEATDANLLARALHWAAESDAAANETFNVTNGDAYVLRNLWPAIADAFGMEVGHDRPLSMAAELPARQREWTELHRRFDLVSPVDLDAFVGQSFLYADMVVRCGQNTPSPPTLLSTVKIRQAGFGECIDTEDMFRQWIAHHQTERLLPPRGF